MKKLIFPSALILVSMIIGIISYPNLTEKLPIHWGMDGVDFYIAKEIAIFIVPISMVIVLVSTSLSVNKKTKELSSKTILNVTNIALLLMLGIHVFILTQGLSVQYNNELFMGVLVGLISIILSNFMPVTKPNAVYGLRTPWTLKNEQVWKKSNRFAGRLLMIVGIFILSMSFILPHYIHIVILTSLLATAIVSVVMSYGIYKKVQE
ncbi:hypothetical protein SporoP8_10905 [Sporosarcina ureae]|uniref:SdpI family protein n=1 Tax=Sporosarcina ureae TaxID=1571 RepID=UPI000A14A531|nr:SdpI family protein [Sporosarcina ureae]ARJ39336.1 hypothetical protein SporoP8_10905 [Sporosarcina ureae]